MCDKDYKQAEESPGLYNESSIRRNRVLEQLESERANLRRRLDRLDRKIELINKHPIIREFLEIER